MAPMATPMHRIILLGMEYINGKWNEMSPAESTNIAKGVEDGKNYNSTTRDKQKE